LAHGGLGRAFYFMEETKLDGRIYELAYLFVPTLEETQAMSRFSELKTMLSDMRAEVISEDIPRLMDLAYEMYRTIANKKTWFDTAYFGWIKFELDPSQVVAIDEKLARDETVLRFMVVKTVRENTFTAKKPFTTRRRVEKAEGEEGVVVTDEVLAPVADAVEEEVKEPIAPEELDKQIDALITE
jgi:ribosomal protein S6